MTADEVERRLADRDCASLADLPTTCPNDDGRLRVEVSPTVRTLSGGPITFTVTNTTGERFKTNYYDWALRKWDGSRWRRIAPLSIPAPLNHVPAGESHNYRLSSVEGSVARGRDAYVAESDITLGGLGPGVYGLSVHGYFESAPDDELVAAAAFGFTGEGEPIRPTDAVTSVERDGSALVVRADASKEKRDALVISFADGNPDIRILPEHVRQLSGLLNTLSFAATDGIDTVRYVGSAEEVQLVETYLSAVTPTDATRYGFRDYTFEVTTGT